jgi:hypothetical protein
MATSTTTVTQSTGVPLVSFLPFVTIEEGGSVWGPYTLFGRVTVGKEDFFVICGAGYAPF